MKKTFSLFLALIMAFGVLTSTPVVSYAASVDDLHFTLNDDEESYCLYYCNREATGEIIIPDTYEGLPVTHIDEFAFIMCEEITSIKVPDSVISIGQGAFADCYNLESITIGNNVESIGRIAFFYCESLETITIPESLTSLGEEVFYGCNKLESIEVDENNNYFSSVDGILFNKDQTVLVRYPQGKTANTYTIPDTVIRIGEYAFEDSLALTSVIISDSVQTISDYAFQSCTGLKSVTFGANVTTMGIGSFISCTSLETVTIPESVEDLGEGTFVACFSLTEINVDENNANYMSDDGVLFSKDKTKLIQHPASRNNTAYVIPNSVISVEWYAFAGCTNLNSITIPSSVTSVGLYAFMMCTSLKSVTIPNSVADIGEAAFGYTVSDIGGMEKIEGFTICGECGTAAEAYADENGFNFDNGCEHKDSTWVTAKKATVYSPGAKNKMCNDCGRKVATKTIAQLKCSKPSLKSIENTEHGVLIKWGKVKGADKYYIYRKTSGGKYKLCAATTNTYLTDPTAKSGKKYYYIVKAENEAGKSDSSNSLSKYHLSDPTLKTPSSSSKGIALKWTKVTGAEGYVIYRKTGSGSYTKLKTEKGVSNLSYRDTSAKKGKKYTYKVKAYYSKTYSAYSDTKTITDKY